MNIKLETNGKIRLVPKIGFDSLVICGKMLFLFSPLWGD
jgi:hypothetical protein